MTEIDISRVLIDGDTATIMGVKYQRIIEPKTSAEEAYKRWWGDYPPTTPSVSNFDDNMWSAFQKGYTSAKEDYKVEEPETLFDVIRNLGYSVDMCYEIVDAVEEFEKSKELEEETKREIIKRNLKTSLQELVNDDVRPIDDVVREIKNQQVKELVRESVKWCEEHPDENPLDWVNPQTPDEPTKPMNEVLDRLENKWNSATENAASYITDDDLNRMLKKWEENPPDFLKFELGKTLEALITRWWCDVFTTHEDWDMETAIDDLCDRVELWLPKSQSSSGTQSVSVIDLVDGYNDALTKIKSKLRNKKDT